MREEDTLRAWFFYVNLCVVLVFLAVMIGNRFLISSGGGSRDFGLPHAYLSPEIPAVLSEPDLSEAAPTHQNLVAAILYVLQDVRVRSGLPKLVPDDKFHLFAHDLAGDLDMKGEANAFEIRAAEKIPGRFPKREILFSFDVAKVGKGADINTNVRNVAELWWNRASHNKLDTEQFHRIGIGAAERAGRLVAILVLGEVVLEYDRPFPRRTPFEVVARIDPAHASRRLMLERLDFRRGWLRPAEIEHVSSFLKPDRTNRVRIQVPALDAPWSLVRVSMDGERLGFGRAVTHGGGAQ